MRLVLIDRPVTGQEATDVVRNFVFMANLEAQESTGDAAASVSVEQVLTRLKGSAESDALLFAAVDDAVTPVVGALGELGVPVLPATGDRDADVEVTGYLHLALPLLEDTDLAELDVTLDASLLPLPGEPMSGTARQVRDELIGRGVEIARRHFQRSRFLVWTDAREPDPPAGFHPAVTVKQVAMAVPENTGLDEDTVIVDAYGACSPYAGDIAELLTQASADTDHGSLGLAPQEWTVARLLDAAGRLRDRRDAQFLALVVLHGQVVSLSEITVRDDKDVTVAELGMTVTRRGHRSEGFGRQSLHAAVAELAWRHPRVTTMYGSAAATDAAAWAMYRPFDPRPVDRATGWLKS